jgi:hypothetical protein
MGPSLRAAEASHKSRKMQNYILSRCSFKIQFIICYRKDGVGEGAVPIKFRKQLMP